MARSPIDVALSANDLAPAQSAIAVTPTDHTALLSRGGNAIPTRWIWVGGAGALSVDMADGTQSILFSGIPAGTYMRLAATSINATGTTATLIVALY